MIEVNECLRSALRIAFPASSDAAVMLGEIYRKAYLPAEAELDEVLEATRDYAASWQRINDLRPRMPKMDPHAWEDANLELSCLLAFCADLRAARLLLAHLQRKRLSIADAAYLHRKRLRKALYPLCYHPLETDVIPTAADIADAERSVRSLCKLPDDLPCERLLEVIEDFAALRNERFWLVDNQEHGKGASSPEGHARFKALNLMPGDKHAVELAVKKNIGVLTDEERRYLQSEQERMQK